MSVFELQGFKVVPDVIHEYNPEVKANRTPIIIENGK